MIPILKGIDSAFQMSHLTSTLKMQGKGSRASGRRKNRILGIQLQTAFTQNHFSTWPEIFTTIRQHQGHPLGSLNSLQT